MFRSRRADRPGASPASPLGGALAQAPRAPQFGIAPPAPSGPTEPRASSFGVSSLLGEDRAVRSVLVVCTGNVCRSPFGERLLQALAPGAAVESMGTHAMVGAPMDSLMAAELQARGGSATGFRSRQLGPEMPSADLILVMSRRQRQYLLEEHPGAMRRVGLLGDAASLAALVPPGETLRRSHVAQWARQAVPADAEIADPYKRGAAAAATAAAQLEENVRRLAAVLSPASPSHSDSPRQEPSA